MKFRHARHTDNLEAIARFYNEVLGLEILGSFAGHDGYDGLFLGIPGAGWHLEFTTSQEPARHKPDEDDLMVFYPESAEEYQAIVKRFANRGILPVEAKNPYWKVHGTMFRDPEGYGVVLVRP